MDYLEGLNDRQKEAVLHTKGPLLIMAGAGSGKTRVVTHKIAYLIKEKGVFPGNILAITFTNKAAGEMKSRVAKLLDADVDSMWMGTFHAICVRILRRDIHKLGYDRSFSIYDRDDQITLLRECFKELNVDKELYKERSVLSQISKLKDEQIDPDKYINENYGDYYARTVGEIYALYQKKLKKYNALDFDDLIIKAVELLLAEKDIREYYQNRFQYVFVDEYQDTNKIQYNLTKILSAKHQNLCVVGDSDQSIYSWRGADVSNILDFEKEFKGAKVVLLEQNYRSTQNILTVANKVIKNNYSRHDKNLWTDNVEGDPIRYEQLDYSDEEARFVADEIRQFINYKGYKASEIAILYRTNAQSRSFEESFMRAGIPYKIVGGLRFYDRKEVKDVIAYLKAIQNPTDNISIKRIINTPKRGIGLASIDKVEQYAMQNEDSLYGALLDIENIEGLSTRAKNSIKPFVDLMNTSMAKKEIMGIKDFIEDLIYASGYIPDLEKEDSIEATTRIENIKEFLSVALTFEEQNPGADMEEFLASVSLLSDVDKTVDGDNMITLMTVHSAKGLEYPIVFLVGMEQGLFPISRSMESDDELEEERRLCYVAVTRAEKHLIITNAKRRTIYGRTDYAFPSKFIMEMGDAIEQKIERKVRTEVRQKPEEESFKIWDYTVSKSTKAKPEIRDNKDLDVKLGDKVRHKKWGEGMVVQVKELEGDKDLTISFDGKGIKTLRLSIAPIEII
ncbi:MAG: DNA helicase PcrA [Tissierellia bacterium]|jgi:DNA helicase-2/ATP-dependent DNA helicase PcrA|nr:DNA helicase PcrA [Tissierellia bacterium]